MQVWQYKTLCERTEHENSKLKTVKVKIKSVLWAAVWNWKWSLLISGTRGESSKQSDLLYSAYRSLAVSSASLSMGSLLEMHYIIGHLHL